MIRRLLVFLIALTAGLIGGLVLTGRMRTAEVSTASTTQPEAAEPQT